MITEDFILGVETPISKAVHSLHLLSIEPQKRLDWCNEYVRSCIKANRLVAPSVIYGQLEQALREIKTIAEVRKRFENSMARMFGSKTTTKESFSKRGTDGVRRILQSLKSGEVSMQNLYNACNQIIENLDSATEDLSDKKADERLNEAFYGIRSWKSTLNEFKNIFILYQGIVVHLTGYQAKPKALPIPLRPSFKRVSS